jgi:hypothetical protein
MILANLSNATLWIFYGLLGVHDPNIWGPNLVGVLLGLLQLTIAFTLHPLPLRVRLNQAYNTLVTDIRGMKNQNSGVKVKSLYPDEEQSDVDDVFSPLQVVYVEKDSYMNKDEHVSKGVQLSHQKGGSTMRGRRGSV